jgi:glycosyltransferase involved in cell wall biosynthesis
VKILFVNSASGLGGGTTSAIELALGLVSRGHNVTVICHPHSTIRNALRAAERVQLAPIAIRAELNPIRPFQIARVLRSFPADVIMADRRKDVKLSFYASRLRPGSALVHRHGAPSPLRDGAVYRAIWPRLDGVIVNSHSMVTRMLERTPWLAATELHVVHNGKNLDVYRPRPELRASMRAELGIAQDAFVVCYHGALAERKNLAVLIRALALRPVGSRIHGLLIGDGESESRLRGLCRRYGVPVTFAGRRDDIDRVLAAADVSAHLSLAEGFSNSVIEALACGLPVIASTGTSHDEQVEDGKTGWLVPPDDEDAVIRSIRLLSTNPARHATMAAAARQSAVQNFSSERMMAGYEAALQAAIRRHHRQSARPG